MPASTPELFNILAWEEFAFGCFHRVPRDFRSTWKTLNYETSPLLVSRSLCAWTNFSLSTLFFNFFSVSRNNISIFPAMCHAITKGKVSSAPWHFCVFCTSSHFFGEAFQIFLPPRAKTSRAKIFLATFLIQHGLILLIRIWTIFVPFLFIVKEFYVHFNKFVNVCLLMCEFVCVDRMNGGKKEREI